MSLADVERFLVPWGVVQETERELQKQGARGYECFVLWSGRTSGKFFNVSSAHVPQQTSYRLPEGLIVRVEGPALHSMNAWLYEHEEMLAVQVHAHPTHAYHSDTDNAYPIITTVGGLSLVAPNFADAGLFCHGTAAYRLTPKGWKAVRSRKLARLVEVC